MSLIKKLNRKVKQQGGVLQGRPEKRCIMCKRRTTNWKTARVKTKKNTGLIHICHLCEPKFVEHYSHILIGWHKT